MTQTINRIAKGLVNLVYPLHCAACGDRLESFDDFGVCLPCVKSVRRYPDAYYERDGARYFAAGYSACIYDGVLKELIHSFKYNGKIALSGILAKFMIDFINDNHRIINGINLVTFVPLHNKRLREREFNQSKLLAAAISKEFRIGLLDTLEKRVPTRHQNELTRNDRLDNLKGVFKVKKPCDIKGLRILLVDDVMTTGATLNECSKTLLEAGADEIICLTLARGLQ